MKKFLLTLFLLPAICYSQPTWVWAKSAGALNTDYANSVFTSPSGEVYATGIFYSTSITFGSTTLTNNGSASCDIFLTKYDASGNVIWAISSGGTMNDAATSVTVDALGNVYVTGWFSSPTIVFGSTTLTNASSGTGDFFLVKYDSNGNVLWAKRAGGADWEIAQCVVVDNTGTNVYISGGFSLSFMFATNNLTSNGAMDVFLGKYDSNGNEIWARTAGGTVNDLANSVITDAAGNIYLPGGFASATTTFGTYTLTNAGVGFPDIFFVKYDPSGNVIWATREGGPDNDHAVWVSKDVFGEIYITGHYHSTSFTVSTTTLNNMGMGDVFVIKYDTAGNALWAKTHGDMDHDFAYSIISDASGNAYVSGMFMSATIIFGSVTLTNASATNEDLFITKYDSAGNTVWAISGGSTGDDFIGSLIADASGNIYAAGGFSSATVTLGLTILTNADNTGNTYDALVAKLDVLTGIQIATEDLQFIISPNPSNGIFTVTMSGVEVPSIEVYNTLGEKVYSKLVLASSTTIDLSFQSKGIYFVKLKSVDKSRVQKLIIH